jgi:hypothetical protein
VFKDSVEYTADVTQVLGEKAATAIRKVVGTMARTNPKAFAIAINHLAGESGTEEICTELIELIGGIESFTEMIETMVEERHSLPF